MRTISVELMYFVFGHVVQEASFKDISYLGGHFVWLSGTICAILLEGIMRNISVKLH